MTKQYEIEEKLERLQSYIEAFTESAGYPPSIREICVALGVPSTATVHYYLKKLSDSGRIVKIPSKNRAIGVARQQEHPRKINLVGNVHAGGTHLAVEEVEETYTISENLLPKSDGQFMLKVTGDSMINAGIYDGDKLVVRKQETAENGDIVVALIGDEATVKRFFLRDKHVVLHPENDAMQDIIADNVQILGVVCGLFRNL